MSSVEDGLSPARGLDLLSVSDHLRDSQQWYARRARRKKIALIQLEVRNTAARPITVDFGRARLSAGERKSEAERGESIARKLSTFQWDFLFYWILHFSVIELAIELSIFFTGALFNRSLRKRLKSILDRQVTLAPGERLRGLIGFRNVAGIDTEELEIPWSVDGVHFEWTRRRLESSTR